METANVGITKVCLNGPGHMTKMAAMFINGENPLKISFSITRRLMTLSFDIEPLGALCAQMMVLD